MTSSCWESKLGAARADGRPPSKTDPDDKHLLILLKKAYIDALVTRCPIASRRTSWRSCKESSPAADRVRSGVSGKIATFCGADAMRRDLPDPPTLSEPVLQNLPPPAHRSTGVWKVGAELVRTRGTESELRVARRTSSWRRKSRLAAGRKTTGRKRRLKGQQSEERLSRSARRHL